MIVEYKLNKNSMEESTRAMYERYWNYKFKTTGDTLTHNWEGYGASGQTTYVIFTGDYTPCGMCRDCGDHFIIAHHSYYSRLEKDTLLETVDVDDK